MEKWYRIIVRENVVISFPFVYAKFMEVRKLIDITSSLPSYYFFFSLQLNFNRENYFI